MSNINIDRNKNEVRISECISLDELAKFLGDIGENDWNIVIYKKEEYDRVNERADYRKGNQIP